MEQQQQQQPEEQTTEIALIEQEKSTVKILQEDDLKSLKDALEKVKGFKRKYSVKKLVVTDIENKEQKEKLRVALADLRTTRTSLKNDKTDKTKPYRETVAYINANFDKVIEAIETIEVPLIAHNKEIKAAIEAKEKEAEIELQNRVNTRVKAVIDAGAIFDGNYYSIGSEEFNVPTITLGIIDFETMTDGIFENVLAQIVEKNSIIETAQAEKIKTAQIAEEARIAKEAEEKRIFDEEQKKLADEKEAFEKEKADMLKMKIESRGEQLQSLGMGTVNGGDYSFGDLKISYEAISNSTASEWSKIIDQFKLLLKEQKKKEEQEQREKEEAQKQAEIRRKHQEVINARYAQLSTLGMTFDAQYNCYIFQDVIVDNLTEICLFNDEEWTKLISKITPAIQERKDTAEKKAIEDKAIADKAIADKAIADQKVKEEQEVKDRIELLNKQGDLAMWLDLLSRFQAISFPKFKSNDFQVKANNLQKLIADFK